MGAKCAQRNHPLRLTSRSCFRGLGLSFIPSQGTIARALDGVAQLGAADKAGLLTAMRTLFENEVQYCHVAATKAEAEVLDSQERMLEAQAKVLEARAKVLDVQARAQEVVNALALVRARIIKLADDVPTW
jgi:predicted YcjX-like family ATPase